MQNFSTTKNKKTKTFDIVESEKVKTQKRLKNIVIEICLMEPGWHKECLACCNIFVILHKLNFEVIEDKIN